MLRAGLHAHAQPGPHRTRRRRLRARLHRRATVRPDARRADDRPVASHSGVMGNNHWLDCRSPSGRSRSLHSANPASGRDRVPAVQPPSARCTSIPGTPATASPSASPPKTSVSSSGRMITTSSSAPTASKNTTPPPSPATSRTSRPAHPHQKRFHVDAFVGDQAAGFHATQARRPPLRRLGQLPRPARSLRSARRDGVDVLRRPHPRADRGLEELASKPRAQQGRARARAPSSNISGPLQRDARAATAAGAPTTTPTSP